MKINHVFARYAGGMTGVAIALALPHIGCLAGLTAIAVGAGFTAKTAVAASYMGGAVVVMAGSAAAIYGLRGSCVHKKAIALAAAAFTAVAVYNTATDKGPDLQSRADYLEAERQAGGSVWDAQARLNALCMTRP